jgi:hypothetical protein
MIISSCTRHNMALSLKLKLFGSRYRVIHSWLVNFPVVSIVVGGKQSRLDHAL